MRSARRADTIAVIGAGEMGAAVGHRMLSKGARVLTTLKGRSAASAERVRLAGIEVVDDDDAIALEAGFLLSIVPPGQAIAVAQRFHGPLARAAKKPVFVECNAISPATMRRIADALESSGCKLVDAGIIGGPPRTDRPDEGPRFYASGQDAHLMSYKKLMDCCLQTFRHFVTSSFISRFSGERRNRHSVLEAEAQ